MIEVKYSKNGIKLVISATDSQCLNISIDSESFNKISEIIKNMFSLEKSGELIADIVGDSGYQDYTKDCYKISIGWAAFDPIYILALDSSSNELVGKVFHCLSNQDLPS